MGLSLFHVTYQRRKHENIQQKHHTDEKWIFFLKGQNEAWGWS